MGELTTKYITVKTESHVEFEEKRSLFIGHAIHIDNEEDAAAFVKKMKKQYTISLLIKKIKSLLLYNLKKKLKQNIKIQIDNKSILIKN